MSSTQCFEEGSVESLARLLADCGSGSDISRVLDHVGIRDDSGESTKWRRLYRIFLGVQRRDRCSDAILAFIQSFLTLGRFANQTDEFEAHRSKLNMILALSGIEYGADGKFGKCPAATTHAEAERRVKAIEAKFRGRRIHPAVLKSCKAELMEGNSFHAVLEATKGLAQRIREKSGVDGDGATLVDRVFSTKPPVLAFNELRTETEKNEHKGFASLLKGCFEAFRNPRAHQLRILWKDDDDTVDYFTLFSFLHRKLDACARPECRNRPGP